ncbi:hypothetical protein [Nocardioides daeguensis]|uniref:SPW repeat-containing protein n=1 Tax=Nocardioides daeguensis TaxID=908359 RepID=A0ABP6WEV8_9ACTN|nr:hypothetical protein [Nocardioides daeguensis]MBV6728000.1 hypothetical protein [Nocardioides daeguensis]MCR1774074.1 hypothetical protein [Nocardioides daeguensis]
MTSVHLLHRATDDAGPRIIEEPAVRFGLGGFALFVTAGLVTALDLPSAIGTAVVLGVTAAAALPLDRGPACGLGLAGWAVAEGFAVHAYGELRLAPTDLGLLAGFVLASLAAALLGGAERRLS